MLVEIVSQFVSNASERKKSSDQKSGSIGNRHFCSSFTWYAWFSPIPNISQQKLGHHPIRRVRADLDFIVKTVFRSEKSGQNDTCGSSHRAAINKVPSGYAHGSFSCIVYTNCARSWRVWYRISINQHPKAFEAQSSELVARGYSNASKQLETKHTNGNSLQSRNSEAKEPLLEVLALIAGHPNYNVVQSCKLGGW